MNASGVGVGDIARLSGFCVVAGTNCRGRRRAVSLPCTGGMAKLLEGLGNSSTYHWIRITEGETYADDT